MFCRNKYLLIQEYVYICDQSRHVNMYSTHKRHKRTLFFSVDRQCILLPEVMQEKNPCFWLFLLWISDPWTLYSWGFLYFSNVFFCSSPFQTLSQFRCVLSWTSGPFGALFNSFHPSSATQARFPPVAESVGADGWEKLCEVLLSEYFPLIVGLARWIWRDQLEARAICTKALYFCIGPRIFYILWLGGGFIPAEPYWRRASPAMTSLGISY